MKLNELVALAKILPQRFLVVYSSASPRSLRPGFLL
jgi:hypothetical protein